ncbi:MAG: arsenate reductase ArsC [Nitrospirae bacterium]|nr:arsenate reductase ArsC [Nitrospirota bacterium]
MPEPPLHVLFLCTENACRSQMAEAWMRHLSGGRVRASSAGVRPGALHPMTVLAMEEAGVSMAGHHAKGLDGMDMTGVTHVVTVCGAAEARCPAFPGNVARHHWPIPDPMALTRDFPSLVNDGFRAIRDNIRDRVSMMLIRLDAARTDTEP